MAQSVEYFSVTEEEEEYEEIEEYEISSDSSEDSSDSDDELEIAKHLFFSVLKNSKKDQHSFDVDSCQIDIMCDKCDKNIVGIRHKCLECPDYDLCDACRKKGFHNNSHHVVQLETPMDSVLFTLVGEDVMKEASSEQRNDFCRVALYDLRAPSYWTNFTKAKLLKEWEVKICRSQLRCYALQNASSAAINEIAKLVEGCWSDKKFPVSLKGRDAAGLQKLRYKKIKVVGVQRIENPGLFKKYAEERSRLLLKAAGKSEPILALDDIKQTSKKKPIKTTKHISDGGELSRDIYRRINEHYLFHGTSQATADQIISGGLDSKLNKRGMFGPAVYFAESAIKADQYADYADDRDRDNVKIMLLSRVCLGQIYVYSGEKAEKFGRPPCKKCNNEKCKYKEHNRSGTGFYDSVVSDSKKRLFREFMVYSPEKCYAEYIIQYKRI